MMTMAIVTAAATNILFSMASSFEAMLLLWAVNGYAQSAGWSLLIQTVSNWNTSQRRGTLIGLISTCYQVGNVLSWLLAGMLCDTLGWRWAFAIPGLLLLPMAAAFAAGIRNRPEDAGFPPVRDDIGHGPGAAAGDPAITTRHIIAMTLANRTLWVLGLGFFCMNSVRYTFMNWAVQYMADFQGRSIRGSAVTAIAIPLIGSLGAVWAGWASDHIFGRRRAPVCAMMLFGLAAVCCAFIFIPAGSWITATVFFGVAGFMIYGPDMLMSGAATVDVSHPRAVSIATGLTMCLGATGAIFSGAGIGLIRDAMRGEWSPVFAVLAGLSVVSALLMVSIWNARPRGAA
jgi:MFS transporter, OPA family, sugar phosphate sensor protein UhpC